jgi:3-oxoacyl-[acyl-carrier protein] reductase
MNTETIALITGSTSGIGLETARALATQGVHVAIVASRDARRARDVAQSITEAGGRASAFVGDVSNVDASRELVRQVEGEIGSIEYLVNSAGVFFPTPVGSTDEAQFNRIVDVNFKGSFFMTNAVAPGMKARGRGRIVNVASVAGISPSPEYSVYAGTKAAIIAMTKAMGIELAPSGVNVNAIAPGNTETPMNADVRLAPEFTAQRARIAAITPSRRLFTPASEIASGIVFLLSDAARGMYGSLLVIDEGKSAGVPLARPALTGG